VPYQEFDDKINGSPPEISGPWGFLRPEWFDSAIGIKRVLSISAYDPSMPWLGKGSDPFLPIFAGKDPVGSILRRASMKAILLFMAVLASLAPMAQPSMSPRPNIVWIVCEDISPYLGCYGNHQLKTPNLDQLARESIRFNHVYTTAGVCAPSRSTLITGMYQTSIGTQHMRTLNGPSGAQYSPVADYSAVIPAYVKCFPEYLRMQGYYCTNNEKQDYQFVAPVTVWDENGPAATWRNRPAGKPFFAVFNFFITHESQLFMRENDSLRVDPQTVTVPPYYPDTKVVRRGIARLFTNIEIMDAQVGQLIRMLIDDGLYDHCILFFYSDHGGALPWAKREVLERGIHIPLLIRFPGARQGGIQNNDLISSVDFAPTVLSLAGIKIPSYMQGQPFLGPQRKPPRKYIFAGRDRMDTEYDRVRAVRDGRYEYLYNYMPEKIYYQNIAYRLSIPMMQEILALRDQGKLDPFQAAWFHTKPVEELYDIELDPSELHNLAADPRFGPKLAELRAAFGQWTSRVGDLGGLSEKEMIRRWWQGQDHAPLTDTPLVLATQKGVRLRCATLGASIGYRIQKASDTADRSMHTVYSWDFGILFNPRLKNGQRIAATPSWNIYHGEWIGLGPGDTLKINALRIGYLPATLEYVQR
jgi:N-sulfoglucosamine sulfohydrolase